MHNFLHILTIIERTGPMVQSYEDRDEKTKMRGQSLEDSEDRDEKSAPRGQE